MYRPQVWPLRTSSGPAVCGRVRDVHHVTIEWPEGVEEVIWQRFCGPLAQTRCVTSLWNPRSRHRDVDAFLRFPRDLLKQGVGSPSEVCLRHGVGVREDARRKEDHRGQEEYLSSPWPSQPKPPRLASLALEASAALADVAGAAKDGLLAFSDG
jgi:hypothetical protein